MRNEHADGLASQVFGRSLTDARNGSSASLGEVLEACRTYLLSVAAREVSPDLRAKISPSDLVQETCVEAHRHFARFCGTTQQELLAWLRSILHHRLKKAHRRFRLAAKRQLDREIPLDGLSSVIVPADRLSREINFPGRQLLADEDADNLARALAQLPAEYQQVIQLRNWELRSFGDIGLAMNRSAEAARSLWSRAVQHLAMYLD